MSKMNELRKDLLEMTPDELREHIRRIRHERRLFKERPSAKRKAKVKSNKSANKVVNMLHTLTAAEVALLLGEVDASSTSAGDADKGEGSDTV